jgi:hypothetical protein
MIDRNEIFLEFIMQISLYLGFLQSVKEIDKKRKDKNLCSLDLLMKLANNVV